MDSCGRPSPLRLRLLRGNTLELFFCSTDVNFWLLWGAYIVTVLMDYFLRSRKLKVNAKATILHWDLIASQLTTNLIQRKLDLLWFHQLQLLLEAHASLLGWETNERVLGRLALQLGHITTSTVGLRIGGTRADALHVDMIFNEGMLLSLMCLHSLIAIFLDLMGSGQDHLI